MDELNLAEDHAVCRMIAHYGLGDEEQILFSGHVQKFNRRNAVQTRIILVTSSAFYNLDKSRRLKRRIDLAKVEGLAVSTTSDEFVMHVPTEYDYRLSSPRRDHAVSCIVHARFSALGYGAPMLHVERLAQAELKHVTLLRTEAHVRRAGPFVVSSGIAPAGIRAVPGGARGPNGLQVLGAEHGLHVGARSGQAGGTEHRSTASAAGSIVLDFEDDSDDGRDSFTGVPSVRAGKGIGGSTATSPVLQPIPVQGGGGGVGMSGAYGMNLGPGGLPFPSPPLKPLDWRPLPSRQANGAGGTQAQGFVGGIRMAPQTLSTGGGQGAMWSPAPPPPPPSPPISPPPPVIAPMQRSVTTTPTPPTPGRTGAGTTSTVSLDDFELLRVIGRGSYGKVLAVRSKRTGEVLALKVLAKSRVVARQQVEHTQAERVILETIDHPFLVKLRAAFQTSSKLYLVLPFLRGGEVFHHLKARRRFDENLARFYAAEIALGIGHLHELDIVYRDLKPENVLLDEDGHVKMTDFGLSKVLMGPGDTAHTFCGTPEYLAPELVDGAPHDGAVDWWALGILVWEMLTGLPPFYHPNIQNMYELIREARLVWPVDADGCHLLSSPARSLLTGLLARDPRYRLGCISLRSREAAAALAFAGGEQCTLRDVEQVKAHPFFSGMDWTALVNKRIPPPWKPSFVGSADVSHFDREFTNEPLADSVNSADAHPAGDQAKGQSGGVGSGGLGMGAGAVREGALDALSLFAVEGNGSSAPRAGGGGTETRGEEGHNGCGATGSAPQYDPVDPTGSPSLSPGTAAGAAQFGTLNPKFEGFTFLDRAALGFTLASGPGSASKMA